jgi:hypothetical protein
MSRRTCLLAVAAAALCLTCAGCLPEELSLDPAKDKRPTPPPEVAGTVGEFATLIGGGSLFLDGHGLAVGLGQNGSSEVPPQLKKHLVEYMLKEGVGSALGGARAVMPSRMIADKDTAVVRLAAVVPPGAPKGWKFDVQVTALTRSGTRSLDGGRLYAFPLFMGTGEGVPPSSGARAWAMAEGSVFLNPFLDPERAADAPRFREGRLIGGGQVIEPRPLRLVLAEPDYARCNVIQRRINQRFGQPIRVANAKNPSTIHLSIPPAYSDNYDHFLRLVTHLPLQAGPGRWEARAREIAKEISQPGTNHEGLALVWEAMGSQIVGTCQKLYDSKNAAAAFYASRTGLRLKDKMAADVMMRFAQTTGSPFRVPAIEELGRQEWLLRSVPLLRQLVDDESVLVRIAAYESLVKLGDTSLVTRIDVAGEFKLDLVTSRRSYVIYATQSGEKRITLFGRDMAVDERLFFDMPDGLVTMADKRVDVDKKGQVWTAAKLKALSPEQREQKKQELRKDTRLMIFRKIPRTGRISAPFYVKFFVRDLVEALGERAVKDPNGDFRGMELTYGQVAAVLYRMCEKDKDIPAKFVLQRPPGTRRIYEGVPTVGRPDMPGE